MKKSFLWLALICSCGVFGQILQTPFFNSQKKYAFVASNSVPPHFTFGIATTPILNPYFFSSYTPATQNNTISLRNNSLYSYNRAESLPENNWRGVKIDSYNPNGATDFGSMVVLGVIQTIFNGDIVLFHHK